MARKEDDLQKMLDGGVVAVVRMREAGPLVQVAEALAAGGIAAIEFTMTTPGALKTIEEVASRGDGKVVWGAGTVLDPETCRAAILAGARFIVAPTLNPKVIEVCRRYSVIAVPGAFTPTEILTAWELGADVVKVFPATALGPQYFKDVLAPLPQVRLMPTGGVSLENTGEFVRAGAAAVAVGGNLVRSDDVAAGRFDALAERAVKFVAAVRAARGQP
ncbi:MAG: bifunctional 4-hydroxy-2-oxoglutarate aldolase/2-dehydro-3-deoxy-phosphogluconate aldolase [Chloroflexota bacterium]